MLSCLIYLTLTLFIPLRLTYHALKASGDAQQARLWSTYWAIYSLVLLLKSILSFLAQQFSNYQSQPFELILVLFHLWLYSEQYRGALLLAKIFTQKIEQFGLKSHINLIGQKLFFLNIFESKNDNQEAQKTAKIE